MEGIIVIFVLNDKKSPSHMSQIGEHINYKNNKINSYDQMSKIIGYLDSTKFEDNKNYTCQMNHLQN